MGKRKKSVFDYWGEDSCDFEPSEAIPTDAEPGSIEKVNELAARLECGEELWHPKDKTRHPKDKMTWIEFVGLGGTPGISNGNEGVENVDKDENEEFPETPRPQDLLRSRHNGSGWAE